MDLNFILAILVGASKCSNYKQKRTFILTLIFVVLVLKVSFSCHKLEFRNNSQLKQW